MNEKEIRKELELIKNSLNEYKSILSYDDNLNKIREYEKEINYPEFWNDINRSSDIMEKLKNLKDETSVITSLNDEINMLLDFLNENEEVDYKEYIDNIIKKIEELKIKVLLSGEYDKNNAYVEIHSGAGGTESNDWAKMLERMYLRFTEKNNFSCEIINEQAGEEVGIKGCLLYVKGKYAFGMLNGETGVHRLVRISPFDANKRRHTSFASVLVTPEIDKKIDVDIKESDVKIDVYRSSGAGGQSVNTTDSAIRITHLPSGIVVTCQNERSQLKNKEKAFEILKGKIFLLEQEKFKEKLKGLKGEVMDVNFGSAIRSYVMCPYSLVKDNRSNVETSNVDKVLDGEITEFIEGYLKVK